MFKKELFLALVMVFCVLILPSWGFDPSNIPTPTFDPPDIDYPDLGDPTPEPPDPSESSDLTIDPADLSPPIEIKVPTEDIIPTFSFKEFTYNRVKNNLVIKQESFSFKTDHAVSIASSPNGNTKIFFTSEEGTKTTLFSYPFTSEGLYDFFTSSLPLYPLRDYIELDRVQSEDSTGTLYNMYVSYIDAVLADDETTIIALSVSPKETFGFFVPLVVYNRGLFEPAKIRTFSFAENVNFSNTAAGTFYSRALDMAGKIEESTNFASLFYKRSDFIFHPNNDGSSYFKFGITLGSLAINKYANNKADIAPIAYTITCPTLGYTPNSYYIDTVKIAITECDPDYFDMFSDTFGYPVSRNEFDEIFYSPMIKTFGADAYNNGSDYVVVYQNVFKNLSVGKTKLEGGTLSQLNYINKDVVKLNDARMISTKCNEKTCLSLAGKVLLKIDPFANHVQPFKLFVSAPGNLVAWKVVKGTHDSLLLFLNDQDELYGLLIAEDGIISDPFKIGDVNTENPDIKLLTLPEGTFAGTFVKGNSEIYNPTGYYYVVHVNKENKNIVLTQIFSAFSYLSIKTTGASVKLLEDYQGNSQTCNAGSSCEFLTIFGDPVHLQILDNINENDYEITWDGACSGCKGTTCQVDPINLNRTCRLTVVKREPLSPEDSNNTGTNTGTDTGSETNLGNTGTDTGSNTGGTSNTGSNTGTNTGSDTGDSSNTDTESNTEDDTETGDNSGNDGSYTSSKIPIPNSQQVFEYNPVVNPVTDNKQVANNKPFSVGDLRNKKVYMKVSLPEFEKPVDVYVGIYPVALTPDTIFVVHSTGNLVAVPLSLSNWLDLIPKWRSNTNNPGTVDINQTVFGGAPINLDDLPPGDYYFYVLVQPANTKILEDNFYLWTTHFSK